MTRRALAAGLALALAGCDMFASVPRHSPGASSSDASRVFLESRRWRLVQLEGEAVMSGEERREPHLILDPESQRATGSGGCNRFTGSYTLEGETLRFGPLASTKMACLQGMEQEQAFHSALARTTRWRSSDDELELFDAKGNLLAQFESPSAN